MLIGVEGGKEARQGTKFCLPILLTHGGKEGMFDRGTMREVESVGTPKTQLDYHKVITLFFVGL